MSYEILLFLFLFPLLLPSRESLICFAAVHCYCTHRLRYFWPYIIDHCCFGIWYLENKKKIFETLQKKLNSSINWENHLNYSTTKFIYFHNCRFTGKKPKHIYIARSHICMHIHTYMYAYICIHSKILSSLTNLHSYFIYKVCM